MFRPQSGYSGFSVDDVSTAMSFYRDVLGLETEVVVEGQMFRLRLPGGAAWVLVYGKPDHVPASFTVVNFVVDDVDVALDDLADLGLEPERFGGHSDARGVLRGRSVDRGPDIAWFTDPAGNVFSVQQP
ncbi:VOC family protein [Frigoribacterium sp. PhB24]|uniref:VOC family protein n=1 Tax=Frigoribacterium sp. PhB24 TaxID=2485204 RepID=UPI000F49149A|nr:VOC family protein [Frigoribacterium sp. PhB24]ROS54208.1 putative enzyme related to lactoylglutathione lyase [Frigoribacterium sp. PhB24]